MGYEAARLPEGIDIGARHMNFLFPEGTAKYWCGNDPVPTHFFHALSVLFPEGEFFFVNSVRFFEHDIKDPVLRQQVKGFIAQEAIHSKEHRDYNQRLQDQGFDVENMEVRVRWGIAYLRTNLSKIKQLAVTCALEHFTAIMAHTLLSQKEYLNQMDSYHAELWKWHAIEETEHKAVAFDVYKASGGDNNSRRRIMFFITTGFILETLRNLAYFLKKDKKLFRIQTLWSYFWWGFVKPGFFRKIIPLYFQYYKRDFHPWDQMNQDLVESWKAEHPGPSYALST